METETQRLPTLLWESLQEICFTHDQKFVYDVSRILGVPAVELKRKVLGTRGVLTTVLVEHGPWWTGLQCSIMERQASLWMRCSGFCDSGTTCAKHRDVRNGWNIRRCDDPYFVMMQKRKPVRYEGAVYWAADDGSVVDAHGLRVTDFTMDWKRSCLRVGINGGDAPKAEQNESDNESEAESDTT